ncbi:MAG: class I SAM-dependent methyltransferase [Oscillospiraceae bacterium]|nr:class I SAM-dependent methyltransferase [Oscillospiraceae bacterium]
MWIADGWKDYRLVDARGGEKIEYWGEYLLCRPEPQAIWPGRPNERKRADAIYHRSSSGGGHWQIINKRLPDRWEISYGDLIFNIKPMGFKHTGLFPEQAVNWDWFSGLIKKSGGKMRLLNLFAYTGGATVAALAAGAEVVHVDASKGMVAWAKENVISSGLADAPVRYIVDDVKKFVRREIRRGRKYDAVIMDPPSYGRGPSGEVWKIENELYSLISDCLEIMSDDPLFFLINSYTTGLSPCLLTNVLEYTVRKKFGGEISADEIGLKMGQSGLALPCGISGRWRRSE